MYVLKIEKKILETRVLVEFEQCFKEYQTSTVRDEFNRNSLSLSLWILYVQAEGIFRINAENGQEEYVRNQLNTGIVPQGIDVHCLAGLIKVYLCNPFQFSCLTHHVCLVLIVTSQLNIYLWISVALFFKFLGVEFSLWKVNSG